jgi:hypothetical protein
MDGVYFRVSSERQTTENQFNDLLQVAEKDGSGRNWNQIHEALSRCVLEEQRTGSNGTGRTLYRLDGQLAAKLAKECIYVEQGRSGKIGACQRPLRPTLPLVRGRPKKGCARITQEVKSSALFCHFTAFNLGAASGARGM